MYENSTICQTVVLTAIHYAKTGHKIATLPVRVSFNSLYTGLWREIPTIIGLAPVKRSTSIWTLADLWVVMRILQL